jgi:hypothetical protein
VFILNGCREWYIGKSCTSGSLTFLLGKRNEIETNVALRCETQPLDSVSGIDVARPCV